MDTKCRHCNPFPLKDTYASILVGNGEARLLDTLDSLEQRLIPCVTAVCPQCGKVTVLSGGTTPSVVNTIVMWKHLRPWIDDSSQPGYEPGEAPRAEEQ